MKQKNRNYPYYNNPLIDTISDLIKLHRDSSATAFCWQYHHQTYRKSFQQTYHDIVRLSAYLHQEHQGEHIAIIGEDCYAWVAYALAITLSGNIAVAIDKDNDIATTKRQLKQCDVKAICYSEAYCDEVKDLCRSHYSFENLDTYLSSRATKPAVEPKPDDTAMIFFTSGTTGASKAVMLSHRNIARDIYAASAIFRPDGAVVSFLPYHHAFGFVTSLLKPYYYGKQTYICSSLKHLMDDFQAAKPNLIFAVPMVIETLYKQIWRQAAKQGKDKKLRFGLKVSKILSKANVDVRYQLFDDIHQQFGGKLRYIICGGAPLDTKYIRWFRNIGIEILNGYGITECSPVIAVNRNHFHRDGSVGQICKDVDVKIIDDEIAIQGDIIMQGYYKDKKATAAVLKDGYFFTGDLGKIDEDGFLYITGRRKNLIILSNGENVSPEEIEKVLLQDAAVTEVIVYAYHNRIIASFYPDESHLSDQDYFDNLIYRYNSDKPKNRQIALAIVRTTEFPRNRNGKILRDKIIEENHHEG